MAVHPMPGQIVLVQPAKLGSLVPPKDQMWNSSIFSCCEDMGICCLGFWCPCCLACQVSSDFGECLCLPLFDLLTGGMVPATVMALRSSIRERYHIKGSMLDDCCIVTFCTTLSVCQMAREIQKHKHHLLLIAAPTTTTIVHMNPPPHAPYYAA